MPPASPGSASFDIFSLSGHYALLLTIKGRYLLVFIMMEEEVVMELAVAAKAAEHRIEIEFQLLMQVLEASVCTILC